MEFYGLPPIGQERERPMDGAHFHTPWVGNAGGGLERNKSVSSTNQGAALRSHPSHKNKNVARVGHPVSCLVGR
jgi:hypothetical protein